MAADPEHPVRTFVLVPEKDLGHAIAQRLREDPAIQVVGVSTDPDKDAYRIFDADPDVIVADFEAALVHGATGIMCRPTSDEDVAHCDALLESVREGTPMRPHDCPAVKRLEAEGKS